MKRDNLVTEIIVLVTVLLFSCDSQSIKCVNVNSYKFSKLEKDINDSLGCKNFEIMDCNVINKQFIYETSVFKKNYNKMKDIAKTIIDSLNKCKNYNYFKENPKLRGLRNFIPTIESKFNGDSMEFLFGITTSFQVIETKIALNNDSLFPKKMLSFFDSTVYSLIEAEDEMEKQFFSSFTVSRFINSATNNFTNHRILLVLKLRYNNSEMKTVYAFEFDSSDEADTTEFSIIKIVDI